MAQKNDYSAFNLSKDPVQGHNVIIRMMGSQSNTADPDQGNITDARFTDILVKMVNQSEAVLTLGSRNPRYLDGENIIVYSMSGPMTDLDFIDLTFGKKFEESMEWGREVRTPIHNRFDIHYEVNVPKQTTPGEAGFNNDNFLTATGAPNVKRLVLTYCRCDTLSFGVAAGKGYAVQTWQGTAEGIKKESIANT